LRDLVPSVSRILANPHVALKRNADPEERIAV